ncbi:MAG: DUF3857 domain-containing protein [Chitinophagaceae bacterium]|jgi:hypothetical protein|nr:DUF3857 domain-containing protein [Chitinophagaceae bacterium]
MRNFLIICCTLCSFSPYAQSILNYTSLTIPDSLKKDADAVYHTEGMYIDIQSPSKMNIRSHNIVTVFTKAGMRNHSLIRIGVNQFYKLDEVNVKVFNELGLEVARYRKKDFKLEGAYDGVTLASDDKLYELDFPVPGLPSTIETEYILDVSSFIDIPSWSFGSSTESFISSKYEIRSAIPLNYKMYNTTAKPVMNKDDRYTYYKWEMKNCAVPKKEPGSYGPKVYMPRVDVSPSQFSYDGYPGSLTNWTEFGKWSFPFYEEQNPFPEERVNTFKGLIQNAKTEQEKIAILYKYLQKETRYVSIQFGIGGFKPFPVSFAEKKKYGDCKGLTHYMKNMLGAVGIKSYAALINAGDNEYPVDPAFASSEFNHVILCVPLEKDTVWLECTGKQTLPGILGAFTENRNALLITEKGGVLVKTPASKSINNQWLAKTNVKLFEDGGALIHSRIFVSGEFWDYIYRYTEAKSKDDIKKALVNAFGYKTPDDLELKILQDSADGHVIEINLAYGQFYDFKAGPKHFFPLRQYRLNDETIKPAETRTYEYLFDFPYIKTDSTTYQLTSNFKKESVPPAKELRNQHVLYKNEIELNESTLELKVITHLTLNNHIVQPKQFSEIAGLFEAIKKDEGQKIVFKKE